MKLRAKWTGQPPSVGEFLMSKHRPKFAYKVVGVEPAGLAPPRLTLEVEKVSLHTVPEDAVVHPWKWDPRTKQIKARHG